MNGRDAAHGHVHLGVSGRRRHAGRHLVTVVVPDVLLGTPPHQCLDAGIDRGRIRKAFQVLDLHFPALTVGLTPHCHQAYTGPGLLRQPKRQRHGEGRPAKEIGPETITGRGHLIGQDAHRLPALQGPQQRPHARRVRRHRRHPGLRPSHPQQPVHGRMARRLVQHGNGCRQAIGPRPHLETADMRRQDDQTAVVACGLARQGLLGQTGHGLMTTARQQVGVGSEPHIGALDGSLAGCRSTAPGQPAAV